MGNPYPAFKNTYCTDCGEEVEEDDDIYIYLNEKYCTSCAKRQRIVCECGNFKKPQYNTCYDCHA